MVIGIPREILENEHRVAALPELAFRLRDLGKQVKFAIHPIAGRMPGHMHVLLAEAEVDAEMLADLREANPDFEQTDLTIVIGACTTCSTR